MNINEILKTQRLPVKVKLNSNVNKLDETFDPDTILIINKVILDDDDLAILNVTAHADDYEHNKSVASNEWYDKNTKEYTANIYESNSKFFDDKGNFNDKMYIMIDDDMFDIVNDYDSPKYSVNDVLNIVHYLNPTIKNLIVRENIDEIFLRLKNEKVNQ